MSTEEFDDIVRKKVDLPAPVEDPRAWDLFMLSAIERGEEKLFEDTFPDKMVKDTLGDYKVEYDGKSWDSLAKKMDEALIEPQAIQTKFDKAVSNSLKDITRKYDAATWPKLAARIDAEEKYLQHYYRAKAIEAILFCFLVLTLFQLGKSGKFNIPFFNPKTQEMAILPEVSKLNTDLAEVPQASSNYLIERQVEKGATRKESIALNSNKSLSFSVPDHNMDQQITSREIFQYAGLDRRSLEKPAASNQFSPSRLAGKIKDIILPRASGDILDPVDQTLSEITEINKLDLVQIITKSAIGVWKFGMYTHADYNQIYLPDQYLLVYGLKSPLYSATTVNSMGYGAGFKAHYIKKRLGAEIGLGYANRSYAPNRKYYLDPYWNINFKKIEYEIVEMPISLKYTSKGNTRLKSYAMVGVNANFISKAIYDVLPEVKSARTSTDIRLTAEQNSIKSRVEDQFTLLDKRRALLYGQGSVGLEWKVNNKMDVYSQLTYGQRVLTKQFGPNWDQFRSLSLELGLKTGIN